MSHPVQNLVVALCVAHARLIDDDTACYVIDKIGEDAFANVTSAFMELSVALLHQMTPQERDEAVRAAQTATRDIVKDWKEHQPHRWN